jgi:hypothetical protein
MPDRQEAGRGRFHLTEGGLRPNHPPSEQSCPARDGSGVGNQQGDPTLRPDLPQVTITGVTPTGWNGAESRSAAGEESPGVAAAWFCASVGEFGATWRPAADAVRLGSGHRARPRSSPKTGFGVGADQVTLPVHAGGEVRTGPFRAADRKQGAETAEHAETGARAVAVEVGGDTLFADPGLARDRTYLTPQPSSRAWLRRCSAVDGEMPGTERCAPASSIVELAKLN